MSTTTAPVMTPWLTTAQTAAVLHVSPATVLRLAKSGGLPHRMVGSQYRFVPEELAEWAGSPRTRAPEQPEWKTQLAALDPYAA